MFHEDEIKPGLIIKLHYKKPHELRILQNYRNLSVHLIIDEQEKIVLSMKELLRYLNEQIIAPYGVDISTIFRYTPDGRRVI